MPEAVKISKSEQVGQNRGRYTKKEAVRPEELENSLLISSAVDYLAQYLRQPVPAADSAPARRDEDTGLRRLAPEDEAAFRTELTSRIKAALLKESNDGACVISTGDPSLGRDRGDLMGNTLGAMKVSMKETFPKDLMIMINFRQGKTNFIVGHPGGEGGTLCELPRQAGEGMAIGSSAA